VRISITRRRLLKLLAVSPLVKSGSIAAQSELKDLSPETVQSPFERRVPIWAPAIRGRQRDRDGFYLKPGASLRLGVAAPHNLADVSWNVRLIGEVDLDRRLRSESGFPTLYRLIDDALDRTETHHSTYSLRLRSEGEHFPRKAYFRMLSDSSWTTQETNLTFWAKRKGLTALPGGRVGVEVAVYRKRPGRNTSDISGMPDATYFLSIGEGTAGWTQFRQPVQVDNRIACVLFTVVGEKFLGSVWLEDPYFPGPDAKNALPPFSPARVFAPYRNWLGENLSETEWPKFRLDLNGEPILDRALFQPEYTWPAAEVEIPPEHLRPGTNELLIQLTSDYHEPLGYVLHRVEWLGIPNGRLEVVSCPRVVDAEKEFSILISTREAGLRTAVEVEGDAARRVSGIVPLSSSLYLEEPGLHFVKFRAGPAGPGGLIRFRFLGNERRAIVKRVVERTEDGVLLGSGDFFYVPQVTSSLRRFFAWYLHNSIGNSIGFRPIYRWGGTRYRDECAWKEAVRLCEGAGLKYYNILDGRELPGMDGNPTEAMLAGPLYMGSQTHEQDGMFNYWGIRYRWPEEELFWDIYLRRPAHARAWYSVDSRLSGAGAMSPLFYARDAARDVREAAEYFISNIKGTRFLAARHSGPSTLFKYFFQAGYKWLAAELMYGPHEVILGALRGASRAYGQSKYGTHLAAEWSTTPHDDPAAFRRYFLALATCYMHGVEHINLEDGLWHMEEGFSADDRFSDACQGHLRVHQTFYRFIRTRCRRGKLRVPIGVLQGRYDGWACWRRDWVWGQEGEEWRFGDPENSWDLLKVFFPRSRFDAIYFRPCPHQPVGFFTGTPYGLVDIVPVEAQADTLTNYHSLIMLGWNTAEASQIHTLLEFVSRGGQLLLSLPHLSTETQRSKLPNPLVSPDTTRLIGARFRGLVESSGNFFYDTGEHAPLAGVGPGKQLLLGSVELEGARPTLINNAGVPLVMENHVGRGSVTFVNAAVCPGHPYVSALYEHLLHQVGTRTLRTERDQAWVQGSQDVSFAVYDWKKRGDEPAVSTIYLLNINWWDESHPGAQVQLLWGKTEIPILVTSGRVHRITLCGDWGVWTQDNDSDILGIEPRRKSAKFRLQGEGKTPFAFLYKTWLAPLTLNIRRLSNNRRMSVVRATAHPIWQAEFALNGPDVIEARVG
jgi:hypothetical protein